jgi:hypothetical protein
MPLDSPVVSQPERPFTAVLVIGKHQATTAVAANHKSFFGLFQPTGKVQRRITKISSSLIV